PPTDLTANVIDLFWAEMVGPLGRDPADVHRSTDARRRLIESIEYSQGCNDAVIDVAFRHTEVREQCIGLLSHRSSTAYCLEADLFVVAD
ncbi:MAG TPA: hypothetical protein VF328_24440, partial [Mycobacterium sp.]